MKSDKDAMEKAAENFVENPNNLGPGDIGYDAYLEIEAGFIAGWQSALNGPAVSGLIEALKFYRNEYNWMKETGLMCSAIQADTGARAKQALAEFERAKGGGE